MSEFKMIDVGAKNVTRRRAIAKGRIVMARETFWRIRDKAIPKGDVLAMAEVAGIMAAKRTSDILPLCHPLSLDSVRVWCEPIESPQNCSVLVHCEAITHAKTGVEMEALAGVSAALLSIYDLTKGVDPVLSISDIHLSLKEGGKSGRWVHPTFGAEPVRRNSQALAGVRVGVLTVSDRCSQGKAEDQSGPAISDFVVSRGAEVVLERCVPDEKLSIQSAVRQMVSETRANVVVTTGGTGIGPRDVTPEAVRELFTKPIQGIGELLRREGASHTQMSWLSRSEAGLIGDTLVVLLPGSPKAVREGLAAIESLIPHALKMLGGGNHG